MNPIQLFDADSQRYTYIVYDADTREAVLIDPVARQAGRDAQVLARQNLRLVWVAHTEADHDGAGARLAATRGARHAVPVAAGDATGARVLAEGDHLPFGRECLRVLHTPGHSAHSVCYVWDCAAPQAAPLSSAEASVEPGHAPHPAPRRDGQHLFSGQTLLINDCARPDAAAGGSAGALYDAITERLFTLPPATIVWPGLDRHGHQQSSVALEKATNVALAGRTREDFIARCAAPTGALGAVHEGDDAVQPAEGYAGDVPPALAWRWHQSGRALLIDVRSDAERAWVGFIPDVLAVAWKQWPGMALNPAFEHDIRAAAAAAGPRPLLLLCRSGVRSIAAARRATELGLTAYNVLDGFEGALDAQGRRGHLSGWRHAGLPWRQG